MKGKGTVDAIFALRQLQEMYREAQRIIHCVFLDLEKAYDRVPREELFRCLRSNKVPEKYVRVIKDMHKNSKTVVRCAAGETEEFEVTVGVHQGSALSPFLFAIIMDVLTEEVRKKAPWQMMFADDVVICAEDRDELQRNVDEWCKALEDHGMKLSRAKSEYMRMNGEMEGNITIGESMIKKVEEFKYLGSTMQSDGGAEKEVSKRIQSGWNNWKKLTGVICDKKVPEKVKGKLHKVVVQPAMLYGMETVAISGRLEKKMDVADMRMERWMLGLTLNDRVTNEEIRRRLSTVEVSKRCRKARLNWYGHVTRRDDDYVGRRVMEMKPRGRRRRGRPRRRWLDCVTEDLKLMDAEAEDARDRQKWRTITSATLL